MAVQDIGLLRQMLDESTKELSQVSWKRMFGCDAVFANGTIFGLVWKMGRIGLKIPSSSDFEALMKMEGAAPWKAGDMIMQHWVLLPEDFHEDRKALSKWAQKAHKLAVLNPKLAKPGKKK